MAKYRSRSYRDIRLVDAFRINWQNALREAEAYSGLMMNSKSFDDRIKGVGILFDVKAMYNRDDIDGYLRYLDSKRDILKKDVYSQSIGPIASEQPL